MLTTRQAVSNFFYICVAFFVSKISSTKMYKFLKDNLGISRQEDSFSSTYSPFNPEVTASSVSLDLDTGKSKRSRKHPNSLPPSRSSSSTLPRNKPERKLSPSISRSSTLPTKRELQMSQYLSTTSEIEPLRDYVTDLSYESIVSSHGTFTRAGPKVSECVGELEVQAKNALEEIKELTEHREALDHARQLEVDRKQGRYLGKFLQSNYDLTIEILNLRTRYLSIKFTFLNGMIEKLVNLDSTSIAPSYLRMKTFNDWLKHSPIIDDIQDEMLQARTKKVRLKRQFLQAYFKDSNIAGELELGSGMQRPDFNSLKRISIRLQSVSHDMVFMKSDINNIQLQLAKILKESKERDTLDALGSLLNDPTSFENRKINEYVKECLECEPVEDRAEEWSSILVFEDNCPEPYTEAVPGANPSRYQEYVSAMTQYICDKLKHAGVVVDPINVFGTLEQRILPRIFTQAMGTVTKPNLDGFIYDKCKRLRGYTQQQIGVPVQFVSPTVLPYYSAISRLKSLVFSMTPTRIMQAISFAANDIHQDMMRVCADKAVGADAFLPIWVYCIINANIPNLATLVNFLKGYLNPDLRYCEVGYYVTCLEGACVYIQEIQEIDYCSDKKYFVFDTEKYKNDLSEKALFRYVEDRTITGYKLFLNKDFLDKGHKLYQCAVVHTGLETDRVRGGVVCPGSEITNVQVEHMERLMSNSHHQLIELEDGLLSVAVLEEDEKEEEEMETEPEKSEHSGIVNPIIRAVRRMSEAAYGMMAGVETTETIETGDSPWLELREGDFTSLKEKLQMVMSLERVGVWTVKERDGLLEKLASGEITSLPESTYARIAIKYGFYLKNEAGIRRFLCEVQLLLRHLRYQSVFVKIDGVLSELTSTAILNFQRELNLGGEYVEKLPETGVLCKDTYDRLRDLLKRILQDLKMLGYQLGFNPLLEQNSEKMISFVTQIQEDFRLGLYLRGSFCAQTRAAIHRHLYDSEVAAWCRPYNPIINKARSLDHISNSSDDPSANSSTVITNMNTKVAHANTFLPGL